MNKYKKLCISFTPYFYDKHLKNYTGNTSRYIETMALEGIDNYDPGEQSARGKVIQFEQENHELKIKVAKLENKVTKLEQATDKQTSKLNNTPGALDWIKKAKVRYQELVKNPPSEWMVQAEGALTPELFVIQNRKAFNRTFGMHYDLEEFTQLIES